MHKISVILPVYNGSKYLEKIIDKIREQEVDYSIEIVTAVSKSYDNSLEICKSLSDIAYEVERFNHAKTRHNAALKSNGDILVFITQDILPYDKHWLNNLIKPLLEKNNVIASYSRQIAYSDATETERLIREYNYPDYDRLCNKNTKEKWGRKNIFYSDSSSATLKKEFLELGGYNFETGTNEDVFYALNVIESGCSILYNSKSKIYHSHNFDIKTSYKRYKLIGEFEKRYQNKLRDYSSLGEGKKLLIHLLKTLLKELKVKELLLLGIDISIRYFGYKIGYKNMNRR